MVMLVCVCDLDSHQFRPSEAGWDAVEEVRLLDEEWQMWWSAHSAIEHTEDHMSDSKCEYTARCLQ